MKERVLRTAFYVFVNLNGDKLNESPEYYVCTGDEAYKKVKQYATRGIIDLTTLNSEQFIDRWDKLC